METCPLPLVRAHGTLVMCRLRQIRVRTLPYEEDANVRWIFSTVLGDDLSWIDPVWR